MKQLAQRLRGIDNKWFFTELPLGLKPLLVFIRGDMIVLLPLTVSILLTIFISLRFMVMMIGVYVAVRYLGEMIYWFAHQFTERRYRPPDFGFKNLDNHAMYIVYQTHAVAGVVVGCAIFLYAFLYMK